MKSFLALGAVALITPLVQANFGFGPCPSVNKMTNFDLSQFTGRWYENWRDYTAPFEDFTTKCTCTDCSYKGNEESIFNIHFVTGIFGGAQ